MTREAVVADKVPLSITGSHTRGARLKGGVERVEINMRAIAYQDAGFWRGVTQDMQDGALVDGYVVKDELLAKRIYPRITPGRSPLYVVGAGADQVRVTPEGASNSEGIWIEKNRIRYPAPWPGVAYLELVDAGHYLDDRILLAKGHPETLAFRLSTTGINWDTLMGERLMIRQPALLPPDNALTDTAPPALTWDKRADNKDLILSVRLPPGDWAGWTLDPTIELQPGPGDGDVLFIIDFAPNTNYIDLSPDLPLGRRYIDRRYRILARWALTAIPANAIITDVQAACYQYKSENASGIPWNSYARRILPTYVRDEVTWNSVRTGVPWDSPGAATLGVDVSSTISATLSQPGVNGVWDIWTGPQMVDDVQGWIGGATNTGWRIDGIEGEAIGDNERIFYREPNYVTPAYRPKLTVEYSQASRRKLVPLMRAMGRR